MHFRIACSLLESNELNDYSIKAFCIENNCSDLKENLNNIMNLEC